MRFTEQVAKAITKPPKRETIVQCARCKEWTTAEEPCCPNSKVIHEGDFVDPETLVSE